MPLNWNRNPGMQQENTQTRNGAAFDGVGLANARGRDDQGKSSCCQAIPLSALLGDWIAPSALLSSLPALLLSA
jgi:hypothetical protein